jgi:hypothetical protein
LYESPVVLKRSTADFLLFHVLYESPVVLKRSTVGQTHNAVEKAGTMSAARSYAKLAVKMFVIAGGPPRKGPSVRKPAVIICCLKTVGESPDGD